MKTIHCLLGMAIIHFVTPVLATDNPTPKAATKEKPVCELARHEIRARANHWRADQREANPVQHMGYTGSGL